MSLSQVFKILRVESQVRKKEFVFESQGDNRLQIRNLEFSLET